MCHLPIRSGRWQQVSYVLVAILTFSCKAHFLAAPQDGLTDLMLLNKVLAAVEKGAEFFKKDYTLINVDGLFGVDVCQGSLLETLKDCSRPEFNCPASLMSRLTTVTVSLRSMSQSALPYIELQDPQYYAAFAGVIDGPYIVHYISERLGEYVSPPGSNTDYDEAKGDGCFSNMLGTFSDTDRKYPKCTIPAYCWNYMTQGKAAGYYITHQLLYFLISEKHECLPKVEKLAQENATSVRDIEKRLCGKIYSEAKEEYQDGNVALLKQDLFLEQSLLCGLLGFQEFFSRQWISMIVRWQSSEGCYTLPSDMIPVQEQLIEVEDKERQLLDLLYKEAKQIDGSRNVRTGRHLLREKTMDGDCLSHKTGLAFGVLGGYVRHLVHQLYSH